MEAEAVVNNRLSYSSYTLLKGCQTRYWHYKVNNSPVDTDYNDEKESLTLGKAFHSLLEGIEHNPNIDKDKLASVIGLIKSEYNLDDDKTALVVAMSKKYLMLREHHPKFSKLAPVAIELKLEDDTFLGFIDVVFSDSEGYWYIGDLKTTARQSETIKARLEMDSQLNLYSYYKEEIARMLNLNPDKFSGCLYIATNKTTTKRKVGETNASYVSRLMGAIESRIYVVPITEEKSKAIKADFNDHYELTTQLRKGLEPRKNLSYCENYFSPCPYWSKCHEHNYTEAELEVWSTELDN
jgi:RecB family exonuclease